ncbi:MAG TPA: methyltransferase domain-containing protein, partial [Aggregatilinea sp.]|uniref:class I SAM-dependent methyltransferase n=1 Tax=Aggregatilinea sp. TaxID=2806333 RepID=UPI002CAA9CEE
MDERDVRFLLHDTGQSALDWLAGQDLDERHTLSLIGALRRTLTPAQASAVLTTARLRQRAEAKFSRAAGMYFTPDALEQASGEAISRWRARRFADLGAARIADLGCGIGGDLLALAAVPGASAIGLDLDPVRLRLAAANLSAYGLSGALVQGDLLDPLPLAGVPAAFFDPARREAGRRIFSVRDMHPPLDVIRAWPFEALAVKLSPGVDLGELWPYTAAGAGVEFVSMGGELKEAVLWRGAWGFAGNRASRV